LKSWFFQISNYLQWKDHIGKAVVRNFPDNGQAVSGKFFENGQAIIRNFALNGKAVIRNFTHNGKSDRYHKLIMLMYYNLTYYLLQLLCIIFSFCLCVAIGRDE
jgi:hypothetical protein